LGRYNKKQEKNEDYYFERYKTLLIEIFRLFLLSGLKKMKMVLFLFYICVFF
jgi:hypothetical protein